MVNWNQFFLEWIQEWIDSSNLSSRTNMQSTYKKAYKSLAESKKEYQHPSQLVELRFIGEKICKSLEKKMNKYCKENNIPVPEIPVQTVEFSNTSATSSKSSRTANRRAYVPRHRSGPYAILLALRKIERTSSGAGGANKSEIITIAKDFCDSSFDPNPNMKSFYSAWNGVKSLIQNDCVYQQKTNFYLTDKGRKTADNLRLVEKENGSEAFNKLWSTPQKAVEEEEEEQEQDTAPAEEEEEIQVWEASKFRIKIFLDSREIKGKTGEDNRSFFADELKKLNFDVQVVALSLGDIAWVAEHVETGNLAILDHILERKRLDDLIASVKDNRFVEQKFRLHRSLCKQVMYLIEHPSSAPVPTTFQQAYQTALAQTTVIDNFSLTRTSGPEDTVKYLATVTNYLKKFFQNRPLTVVTPKISEYKQSIETARNTDSYIGIDYDVFSKAMSKSGMLTIRDVYIKMLMCVRGITWEKAAAIQKVYKTPWHLWKAYSVTKDDNEKKFLVHNALKNHVQRKRITKQASERLFDLWGSLPSLPEVSSSQ